MEVVKTITLNLLEPTRAKQERLKELEHAYREALSFVVFRGVKARRTKLQGMFYGYVRGNYGLHSQIVSDLFEDAIAILNNGGEVRRISIPFNIPRSGRLAVTRRGNPIVVVATLSGRTAVPVAMDGAFRRF